MNKLMCAIGAAAIAGIAMADVTSANIVGYNNVFVKGNKMNLLTISWESVGKTTGTLNEVMGTDELTSVDEEGVVYGDYIDTWDMSAGNWGATYYYVNQPSWNGYDEDLKKDLDYTDTWMDIDGYPVDIEMVSGSSFWLFHKGADIEALPFAGQVTASSQGYTLTGGKMNLCGNPYPTLLNLGDKKQVVITGATSVDEEGIVYGDYIDTWDLTTANWGATYYYVNQPSWNCYDEDLKKDLDYTDTWMDIDGYPASTDIQAGAGFWYFAKNPGVTFQFVEITK